MATTTPLLDLSTLVEAQYVRIAGELYPLRHVNALSIGQVKRLERDSPRLGALLQQHELTEAEEAEASRLLDSACRIVLDAPDDVHVRLGDLERIAVMDAFTRLRSGMSQPAGARAAASRTGGNTSPGSNASTAATRRGGTRASQ